MDKFGRISVSVWIGGHAGAFASFRFASPARPGSLLRSRGFPALSSTVDTIAVRRGHRHCPWFGAVQEIEHGLQRQVVPGQKFRHDSGTWTEQVVTKRNEISAHGSCSERESTPILLAQVDPAQAVA
jgi:hypothetical protein